jgi:hypothetical protein
LEKAVKDLQRAHDLERDNATIATNLRTWKQELQEQNRKDRRTFGKMFTKGTIYPDDDPDDYKISSRARFYLSLESQICLLPNSHLHKICCQHNLCVRVRILLVTSLIAAENEDGFANGELLDPDSASIIAEPAEEGMDWLNPPYSKEARAEAERIGINLDDPNVQAQLRALHYAKQKGANGMHLSASLLADVFDHCRKWFPILTSLFFTSKTSLGHPCVTQTMGSKPFSPMLQKY